MGPTNDRKRLSVGWFRHRSRDSSVGVFLFDNLYFSSRVFNLVVPICSKDSLLKGFQDPKSLKLRLCSGELVHLDRMVLHDYECKLSQFLHLYSLYPNRHQKCSYASHKNDNLNIYIREAVGLPPIGPVYLSLLFFGRQAERETLSTSKSGSFLWEPGTHENVKVIWSPSIRIDSKLCK